MCFSRLFPITIVIIGVLLANCGARDSDNKNIIATQIDSTAKGMALINTDVLMSSSELAFYDFATGEIATLRAGQSGDPDFFVDHQRLWFFNRSSGFQNFFSTDFSAGTPAVASEKSFKAVGPGDPHAILMLDDKHMLLANLVNSSLIVMNVDDGSTTQTVEAAWDLPAGGVFRPENIWSADNKTIFVLHQGFDASYQAIAGAQIFVLKNSDGKITAHDLDATKSGIQGVPIGMTAAERFEPLSDGRLLLFGTCSPYAGSQCKAAIEIFNPNTLKIDSTWDITSLKLEMNGVSTLGATDNEVIANVVRKDPDDSRHALVVNFNVETRTTTTVHTYSTTSIGAGRWTTSFDRSSRTVFIGEGDSQTEGTMIMYRDQQEVERIKLPRIPYKAAFIAR